MPLLSAVAGRYAGTYLAAGDSRPGNFGLLTDDGFELSWQTKAHLVNKTDSYGESLINGIFTGADFKLRLRCKEFPQAPIGLSAYNDGVQSPLRATFPWGLFNNPASQAVMGFTMGTPGDTFDNKSGSIVLSATQNTSAFLDPVTGVHGIQVLTASKCIADPSALVSVSLAAKLRELPVQLLLLPYQVYDAENNLNNVWYTVT